MCHLLTPSQTKCCGDVAAWHWLGTFGQNVMQGYLRIRNRKLLISGAKLNLRLPSIFIQTIWNLSITNMNLNWAAAMSQDISLLIPLDAIVLCVICSSLMGPVIFYFSALFLFACLMFWQLVNLSTTSVLLAPLFY